MQASLELRPDVEDPDLRRSDVLRDLLGRMQVARSGSLAFDAAIVDAFGGLPRIGPSAAEGRPLLPGPHCSTVLMDVMGLLPSDYNFSLGRRDGVCWAWIQPNDDWRPAEGDARHDHPGGSGLAVADTPVLAVACAAIRLHIRLIEHRQRAALHRLMYASRSTLAHPESDLTSIVSRSRFNNARDGITSVLLLFDDGVFWHILEGTFTQVENNFTRIRNDRRHADLQLVQSVPTKSRRYPEWPMGFARNCPSRSRLGLVSAGAMLDLVLGMEYQQDHWAYGSNIRLDSALPG